MIFEKMLIIALTQATYYHNSPSHDGDVAVSEVPPTSPIVFLEARHLFFAGPNKPNLFQAMA
jgi:hypothetical protein